MVALTGRQARHRRGLPPAQSLRFVFSVVPFLHGTNIRRNMRIRSGRLLCRKTLNALWCFPLFRVRRIHTTAGVRALKLASDASLIYKLD